MDGESMNQNPQSVPRATTEPDSAGVEDLVLVSNREPYRHEYRSEGTTVDVETPAGGLAIGIDPVMQRLDGTWIAWGDGDADFDVADDTGQVTVPPSDPEYTLQRVRLTDDQVSGYYDGYTNQGLWPLCHSDITRATFDRGHWQQYRAVNERFAAEVLDHADSDSTVWFQDYHFGLAPRMVREQDPDPFLLHFYHIPWPAPDVFRICPQADALLEGLLGNDLLGFHRPRYGALFLQCVDQFCQDATIDWSDGRVHHDNGTTTVDAFPFAVDADRIREIADRTDGRFWRQFRREHGIDHHTTVAIGIDRLDYTKGLPRRLSVLERLFETRPDLQGEFTYVQKASPTRERIPAYQNLRERVESKVEAINEQFGTDEWTPVVYTTEMYDRQELFSLYRHSDLALVGPVRDGMNLVAKEYVVSQVDDDGVLLLSPLAGAYAELSDGALAFDPYDPSAAAEALEDALELSGSQRQARMRTLRRQVHEQDLSAWLDDVLTTVEEVRSTDAANR
jgi:trehalose 6-phosphate synthase